MPKDFDPTKPDRLNATGVPTKWGVRIGWLVGLGLIALMIVLTVVF